MHTVANHLCLLVCEYTHCLELQQNQDFECFWRGFFKDYLSSKVLYVYVFQVIGSLVAAILWPFLTENKVVTIIYTTV